MRYPLYTEACLDNDKTGDERIWRKRDEGKEEKRGGSPL